MKEYGVPDSDPTAYNKLLESVNHEEVDYILHNQRKPIDARMCQMPGSLTIQAILKSGIVISVRQISVGSPARVIL